MKTIQLRKVPLGKDVPGKQRSYRYEAVENGQILCTRTSKRDYYACDVHEYSMEDGTKRYYSNKFFGRPDLLSKAMPMYCYAVATIDHKDQ